MSRSKVGTSVTRAPSMKISPWSAMRNPATKFSSVVLPQPDGPSSVMNSPRLTLIHASCNATALPNRLVTPSRRTAVSALDGCGDGPRGIADAASAAMVDIEHLAQTEKSVRDDQQQRRDNDKNQAHRRHRRIGVFADVIVHGHRQRLRSLAGDEQRRGKFVERQDRGEQPST